MIQEAPDTVTREQREAFKSAQRPSRTARNNKEKVRALWPEIRQKREAGWSVEEVRQELQRVVGLHSSPRTLYRYIKELSLAPELTPVQRAQEGWLKQREVPRKSITDLLNEPP